MTAGGDERVLVHDFLATRDEAVFRELYRRHTGALYAMALRMTGGNESDAEEIVQESWVRAVDGMAGFRWRSSLRTWLIGIVINCSRSFRRRQAREPEVLPDSTPGRSDGPILGDRIDLERAIARLPNGYREVLVLYDVEGYTHREIGRLLGIAVGTCKSQLSRARQALRAELSRGLGGRTS